MPIIEATQAGHAFVYDQLDERLATARARVASECLDAINASAAGM